MNHDIYVGFCMGNSGTLPKTACIPGYQRQATDVKKNVEKKLSHNLYSHLPAFIGRI